MHLHSPLLTNITLPPLFTLSHCIGHVLSEMQHGVTDETFTIAYGALIERRPDDHGLWSTLNVGLFSLPSKAVPKSSTLLAVLPRFLFL